MRYRRSKRRLYFSIIFALVVSIGIGYSIISSSLGVNGNVKIAKRAVNVMFENIVVDNGSATANTPATIVGNVPKATFNVLLNNVGDYYKFDVNVTNKGTTDAMLSSIIKTDLASNYEFKITYKDGVTLNIKDKLIAGASEQLTITVTYKTSHPSNSALYLAIKLNYVMADDSAQEKGVLLYNKVFAAENIGSNGAIDTTDSEQTFITGTDPNNYVWYSGKLWRAVSKDTSDNSVKLITQWNISAFSYTSLNNSAFQESYIEDWLNNTDDDGFLGTLYNYPNFIKTDSKWNATLVSEGLESTKPAKTTIVTDAVGLLNVYEYIKSYTGTTDSNGYLNNGLVWWSLAPNSSSYVWYVNNKGNAIGGYSIYCYGVRPVINLKSDALVSSGNGSINNPYKLKGDNNATSSEKLNTRKSGEYVKFNNVIYRIVNIVGDKTKIMTMQSVGNKSFDTASSALYDPTRSTNIGYYLNNDWYNSLTSTNQNMIDVGTWYRGVVTIGQSYKLAKETTTNASIDAKVGLIRYGELMAGQFARYESNTYNWTVAPSSSSRVWFVYGDGYAGYYNPTDSLGVRPSMYLKADVYITGGTGLPNDPYILSQ